MASDDLIANFCAITAADESIAVHYLEACNFDVEAAISQYFNMNEGHAPAISSPTIPRDDPISIPPDIEDDIRPPMESFEDTLVESYPRFMPPQYSMDAFRNFQRETLQREGQLDPGFSGGLAELFKPPLDLLFPGTFDEAKREGVKEEKWILVNVQDMSEFTSHAINRDLWSDGVVRTVVQASFIFMQLNKTSMEGRRFLQFYPTAKLPAICFIDPRTGERLETLDEDFSKKSFLDRVQTFLDINSLNDFRPRARSRIRPSPQPSPIVQPTVAPADPPAFHPEMSEDEQLARAIAASLDQEVRAAKTAGTSAQPMEIDDDAGIDDDDVQFAQAAVQARRRAEAEFPPTQAMRDRQLRQEQDYEFHQALASDRAKQREKEEEERRRLQAEETERLRKQQEEEEKQRKLRSLPPEPAPTDTDVATIQFRMPNGPPIARRFRTFDHIQSLYDFVASVENAPADFDIIQSFPRKTFHPSTRTLQEEGLLKSVALLVSQK
eukprot:TRINITY_DN14724_c0_g1::TRINITY_DN14724_c0_g1_i1::g.21545::m.21545 TRINITY_DN14724_c0_g1::TRINITY_DN14724_c0_g1_i1::g.21545  ORF type:complete len:512 (+),score=66.59,sp/Q5REY7/UBXN7_PONAB/33.23/6e-45,UBX/PF00789.15/8.6e-15,UBA_4/PF14555.1/3.5e-14,Thioredoxin_7/PF13899.1/1.3e-09,UIM/PF02809.15/0.012,UIM/PF02809.15/1.9e+03,CUE/PF02845.11/0.064,CUE/PF02845.11/5.1e+03,DRY_EERY/PF09750.4/1.4 TRINITY_DN14724_c0_g1_i1:49-1536(+)